MSHTTTIKGVKILDIEALSAAAASLTESGTRCSIIENATPRAYRQGQIGKCDYVLKLEDGKYDVGFQKQDDGSYSPTFDAWQRHVADQIGLPEARGGFEGSQEHLGKFMQAYSTEAARNAAMAQGYMVSDQYTTDTGEVVLTIEV